MRALRRDVMFLREKKIMDYSLLLGIEEFDVRTMKSETLHVNNRMTSRMSDNIYYGT